MNIIKKYVPKSIKRFLIKQRPNSNTKFCPLCKEQSTMLSFPYGFYFDKFYENGFAYSPFLFETLNLKHYKCSKCLASDRERLMVLFLEKYMHKEDKRDLKLLDIAPSKGLQPYLKSLDNVIYRSADLERDNVDDKVDITDMNIYEDESFNIFICSHILEHVEEDIKAMKELYRVTKTNGIGLCLVPIMLSLKTSVENKEYLENDHLRWKYFGQNDHVRMYSKNDFVERLQSVGFKVEQLGINYFGKDIFNSCGLDEKSVLYVVKK